MRALVTGGTGFIGTRLCRRLSSAGHDVFVLTRRAAGNAAIPPGEGDRVRRLEVDLLDRTALGRAVTEVSPEAVFHLAAARPEHVPEGDARWLFRVNGEATMCLLEACAALSPLPKVVYASSMSVYPYESASYVPLDEHHPIAPQDLYGMSKRVGELHCGFAASHSGLACSILRISGVFGPGKDQGLIYRCLLAAQREGEVRLPRGDVTRDFVYVDDVAEALVLAVPEASRPEPVVYNIGSGTGSSLMDVVASAERVTGRPVRVALQAETPPSHFWYDIRKAEQALGYRPHNLVQGMEAYWRALTENRATLEGGQ